MSVTSSKAKLNKVRSTSRTTQKQKSTTLATT